MQSKTSLFNKGIFRSNMVRFWPVALAYLIISILSLPANLFTTFNQSRAYYASNAYALKYILPQTICYDNSTAVLTLVASFIAVALIFGYLYTSRNAFMMAAFPVERKTLYWTGVITTAVLLIVPAIINVIVTYIIACIIGAAMKRILIFYFILTITYICIFVGIALISVFLAGNFIGAIVNYLFLNFGFSAFLLAMNGVFGVTYFGFTSNYQTVTPYCNIFNPVSYIAAKTGINFDYDAFGEVSAAHSFGYGVMVAYILVAAVLIVLGRLAYKKRRMEVAGDLTAFKFVKVILQVAVSALASLYVASFVCSGIKEYSLITYGQNFVVLLIIAIISGFVVFYIFEMVENKSFRVFSKKLAKRCCIYSAAIALLLIVIKLDPTGYEKKIPDVSELEWAGISSNWAYTYVDTDSVSVTELHKYLVANKQDYKAVVGPMDDEINRRDYITIKYKYKNGKMVARDYVFFDKDAQHAALEAIADFYNNPQRIKEGLIAKNWDKFDVKSGEIYNIYPDGEGGVNTFYDKIDNSEFAANKIYEAFLKDIDQGNYKAYTLFETDRYINDISFNLVGSEAAVKLDAIFWEYVDEVAYDGNKMVYISLYPTPRTTNVINALISTHVINSENDLYTDDTINQIYDPMYPMPVG